MTIICCKNKLNYGKESDDIDNEGVYQNQGKDAKNLFQRSDSMSNIFGYDSFGSQSSSSSNGLFGINLVDYASIRNGSYRKLVSAHYANQKAEEEGSSSSSNGVKDSKQTLNSITNAASNLKDSASALLAKGNKALFQTKTDANGNSYVDYDTDKMYKAVKEFADNYNSMLDAAANSEDTKILRSAKNMVSYTEANKKALAAVGITVGSDNKLTVDEDDFKAASKARVQSLFNDTGSYAYQISSKADSIKFTSTDLAKKADYNSSQTYKSSLKSSISTSKDSTKTLGNIQDAADDAKKSLAVLLESGYKSKFNKVTTTDKNGNTVTDYDKDAIYKAVSDFINDYNTLLKKTDDSKTSNITQARKTMTNYVQANKSALSAMGITIGSDNKLSISESTFKDADMSKVKSLFQDKDSLGKQLEQQITKINTYAESEASKSNTYKDNGSYSYNYNSGDWYNSLF